MVNVREGLKIIILEIKSNLTIKMERLNAVTLIKPYREERLSTWLW